MDVVSPKTAEYYTWGDGCDGWHLMRNDGLSVIEERMPPGASEILHFHHHSRQFFYVLSGELSLQVDGSLRVLKSGQGIEIAPGAKHKVSNETASDVCFLVISSPPSHGDRVNAA